MYIDFSLLARPKDEEQEAAVVVPSCTAAGMDDDNSGCCSGSVVVDAGDSPPEAHCSWRGMLGDGGLLAVGGLEWDLNHFIQWDAVEESAAYDEGEGVVVEELEGVVEEEKKVKGEVVDDDVVWHWDWDPSPVQQHQQLLQQEGTSSLNLNLNYQEVLDAWSGRGSLWADWCSEGSNNGNHHHHHQDYHSLEVPTIVDDREEKEKRRARVMKYREKRHCRLFAKKIRYEVRRLNAEKRPRLRGRFVKTDQEKMPIR